jgi:hypothetical protein
MEVFAPRSEHGSPASYQVAGSITTNGDAGGNEGGTTVAVGVWGGAIVLATGSQLWCSATVSDAGGTWPDRRPLTATATNSKDKFDEHDLCIALR